MTVKAVQNDNSRGNVFASVMKATVTGGVTGYIAKQVIPLTTEELKDIPFRSIISVARKESTKDMVAKLKGLEARNLAQDTFIQMVKEKKLGGIQLIEDGNQAFTNAYTVTTIPRFILLDKEGKIIDADAPRPSESSLVELFDSLEGL